MQMSVLSGQAETQALGGAPGGALQPNCRGGGWQAAGRAALWSRGGEWSLEGC